MGDQTPRRHASPPCLACEFDPTYFDPLGADPEQARDVARWRKAERERLRAERLALDAPARRRADQALAGHLRRLLDMRSDGARGRILAGYWPIAGEPDLRATLCDLHADGVTIALPVVETQAAPLVFRRWTPASVLVRGHAGIPVPSSAADALTPDILLAPVLGWDERAFRLGYGGGYVDRTLAALARRPFAIAIGYRAQRLATIFPQPHDIALDVVLVEDGVAATRGAS